MSGERINVLACLDCLLPLLLQSSETPSLGNGVAHSGLGVSTSMNNQDSSSQTYHSQNGSRLFLNDDSSQGVVGCVKLTVNNQYTLLI